MYYIVGGLDSISGRKLLQGSHCEVLSDRTVPTFLHHIFFQSEEERVQFFLCVHLWQIQNTTSRKTFEATMVWLCFPLAVSIVGDAGGASNVSAQSAKLVE